jgi:carboxymethylenebutenolidase
MCGQFAIAAAAKGPDRIKAAASIYGVALITDVPDSPHELLGSLRGEVYIAIAEHDAHAPAGEAPALCRRIQACG